jgi:hypothetical protein
VAAPAPPVAFAALAGVMAETEQRILRHGADQSRDLHRAIAELTATVTHLREMILLERAQARRSNLLSFWGGVALSIPIGFAINLLTR